jgi:hypothetical protein
MQCSSCGAECNGQQVHARIPVCGDTCAREVRSAFSAECVPAHAVLVRAMDPRVQVQGRCHATDDHLLELDWPCCKLSLRVRGTRVVGVEMRGGGAYFDVWLDGRWLRTLATYKDDRMLYYRLCRTSPQHQEHLVTLVKRTEPYLESALHRYRITQVRGFLVQQRAVLLLPPAPPARRIEWLGDSDLAGLGNEALRASSHASLLLRGDLQNADMAFGAVCSRTLQADYHVLAWSGAGVCHQQELFIGREKLPQLYLKTVARGPAEWHCWQRWQPHLVVLYCGANDFSHWPRAGPVQFAQAYAQLLQLVRRRNPEAHICAVTLAGWRNLTACEWGSARQWLTNESLRQGVATAVQAVQDARVHHLALALPEDLDPRRHFGLLMHWNLEGHRRVAEALAPLLRAYLQ